MISAIFGPLPVDEGIERCKEFLATAGDDPTIRAFCCVERAVLEAMSGEFELARELLGRRDTGDHRPRADRLGRRQRAGDVLRRDARRRPSRRRTRFASATRPWRTWASEASSRRLQASSRTRSARSESSRRPIASAAPARRRRRPTTCISQVLWRTARAKIRAERGDAEGAEVLAREAVRPRGGNRPREHPGRRAPRPGLGARSRPSTRGCVGCRRGGCPPLRAEGQPCVARTGSSAGARARPCPSGLTVRSEA